MAEHQPLALHFHYTSPGISNLIPHIVNIHAQRLNLVILAFYSTRDLLYNSRIVSYKDVAPYVFFRCNLFISLVVFYQSSDTTLQQGCRVGVVTFINVDLSTSSNSAPATSLCFDAGGQHGSLPMNTPSSSSYVASHPPLVSMDGALSGAATVPDISRNLEQLIEVLRGRWYSLVSAPSVEDTVAILEKI